MPIFRTGLRDEIRRVREAAEQAIGLSPYPVQIQGGLVLERGGVAEMQTGEGKTLTAILPAYLHARTGRPVLIATANDYLAHRDAEQMRPVFEALNLSVGCIQTGQSREQRREMYGCSITYGTAREFGFDYLKDRLEERRRADPAAALLATGPARVQTEPGFLLLDEADSLLIDEARTPLIISGPLDAADRAHAACYRWAAEIAAGEMTPRHYSLHGQSGWPALTAAGRAHLRTLAIPDDAAPLSLTEIHHFVERALFVNRRYERDRHYVVRDGQVHIVDEFTGRIQPGRTWNDGIHQAVEAREEVPLSPETGHLARVTMQEFVRRFPFVAGMTGTAREAAREFRAVYGLRVYAIPTHRPVRRKILPPAAFPSGVEKAIAIVRETRLMLAAGRAVLVGTPSIGASQRLSERFSESGVEHVVLNALNPEQEAEIISQAGQPGRVTIATNMAGRGADIELDASVRNAGGLHVIGAEMHAAARIDRQLAGRCGRQGDPGSYRQFLSWDDEILTLAYGERRAKFLGRGSQEVNPTLFRQAQLRVEREHFRQRQELMQFDREIRRATEALGLDPVLDAVD